MLDPSGLLEALDASQHQHRPAAEVLREAPGPFLLSPFVLTELDHLLSTRVGLHAELALLGEVSRGAYRLESGIGLADASIVVLADRQGLSEILTLDERHFRALRDARGRPFRLLPADRA